MFYVIYNLVLNFTHLQINTKGVFPTRAWIPHTDEKMVLFLGQPVPKKETCVWTTKQKPGQVTKPMMDSSICDESVADKLILSYLNLKNYFTTFPQH